MYSTMLTTITDYNYSTVNILNNAHNNYSLELHYHQYTQQCSQQKGAL
jgi:hypothetical protein